ncbi:uncharacterized protein LOC144036789 [Vanacampus margaritifer]
MTNMQSLETMKATLQDVNEKKLENTYKNILQLEANKGGMEKISLSLKNMLADLDQMTDQVPFKSKLLLKRSIQLGSLLSSMVKQKEELEKDKEKMEQLHSELKVGQDHLMANMKSLETVKATLQEVNEKKLENTYKNILQLEANKGGMEKISLSLKNMLADLDQMTDQVPFKSKLLLKRSIQLGSLLSSMGKQKEELEKDKLKMEQRLSELKVRQDHLMANMQSLETVKATLQDVNEKKIKGNYKTLFDSEANKKSVQKITLDLKKMLADLDQVRDQVPVKSKLLLSGSVQLGSLLLSMVKQKEDLDVNRQDVDAATVRINKERTMLNLMKNSLAVDQERLTLEKEKTEQLHSELKVQQDHLMTNMQSLETVKATLQDVNEKKVKSNYKTLHDLEANKKNVQKVTLVLKKMIANLDQVRDQVPVKSKLLLSGSSLLSRMGKQKEELDRTRQDIDAATDRINNERTMLNSMKNNLDVDQERLTLEKEKTEQLHSELKVQQDHYMANMQSLETEKATLQEVNEKKLENIYKKALQLEANKDNMEKISLTLKSMLADLDQITIQIPSKSQLLLKGSVQLGSLLSSMVKQKEELDVNRQDVDAATVRINKERTMLNLMKNSLVVDLEKLTLEKEKTEQLHSELKVQQDHLMTNMQSLETVKATLQDVNEKKVKGNYKTLLDSEANKKSVQKITLVLKKMLADLDQVRDQVPVKSKLLLSGSVQFGSLLSSMGKQKEELEKDKEKMEQRLSELKVLQDHLMANMQSLEKVKATLQDVNEKKIKGNYKTLLDSEANKKSVQKITLVLKKMLADLDQVKDQVPVKSKLLLSGSVQLGSLLSSIVKQKEELDVNRQDVEKHFCQIQESVQFESEMMKDSNQIKVQRSEASGVQCTRLSRAGNASEFVRAKLKLLNHRLHDNFEKILHQLAHRNKYCLYLSKIMEDMCHELEQKLIFSGYRNLTERKTTHIVMNKSNKGIQTEVDSKKWQRLMKADEIQNKDHKKYAQQNRIVMQTKQFETKSSLEKTITSQCMQSEGEYPLTVFISDKIEKEQKQSLSTQPESLAKRGVSTVNKTSKIDCLRKIWKDTNMEKKEIDQMKCTGYEMRKYLEKQLKSRIWILRTRGEWPGRMANLHAAIFHFCLLKAENENASPLPVLFSFLHTRRSHVHGLSFFWLATTWLFLLSKPPFFGLCHSNFSPGWAAKARCLT